MKFLSATFLLLSVAVQAADTNEPPTLVPACGEISPTFWEQHGTLVIIGCIALLVLAALAVWKMLQPKPAVIFPPEVVAREALAKLQDRPEDGKILGDVSRILRLYVVAAFDLPAAELTTKEFCAALAADKNIGTEAGNSISIFLGECDERKFSSSPSAPLNAAARALELVALAEKRRASIVIAK